MNGTTTDIVTTNKNTIAPRPSLYDQAPNEMVCSASEIATTLKDVIDKQKLYSTIGGNKYVRVEGWQVVGTMLGITPRETKVIEHPDGSFEAHVDLVNVRTGLVIGGGSGYCGVDESRWRSADKFARRSMSITRATGKAFRISCSWIVQLAGYEPTPYEEMPTKLVSETKPPEKKTTPTKQPSKAGAVYEGSEDQKKLVRSIFAELNIDNKDEKTAVNKAIINWKIPATEEYLEPAVKQAIQEFRQNGSISAIPF